MSKGLGVSFGGSGKCFVRTKWPMEGSHFQPGQGTFPKIGVQFWGKVLEARYTPPFDGHGRVKVGVDQSAVSVSRCRKVGTLPCRFLTRIYPVVSFTQNV